MHYVYILTSQHPPTKHYTGHTTNLRKRLHEHNRGECSATAAHRPWNLKTAISFQSRTRAKEFERYLKTGSGRAFARRHF